MNGVNRRIVVLRDIHSNLIEEAILVLRTEPEREAGSKKKPDVINSAREKDFILKEAESIINNYMEQMQRQLNTRAARQNRDKSFKRQFITNLIINSILAGSIILLIVFVSRFF